MAVEKVIGIAVLSGKGGVGKSAISLNLALGLGSLGVKTLLFDAGGGDLVNMTNSGIIGNSTDETCLANLTENVALHSPSTPEFYSVFDENDIDDFLADIVKVVSGYKCVVFDCPSGSGPVPYTLAGLSEISIVVSTPDPTSIAAAYLLTKSLYFDGLAERCGILFNQVESPDQAASLQTRFNLLTNQFIQHEFEHVGYVHQDNLLAESILEQQPLLMTNQGARSGMDIFKLVENIHLNSTLHFETADLKSQL